MDERVRPKDNNTGSGKKEWSSTPMYLLNDDLDLQMSLSHHRPPAGSCTLGTSVGAVSLEAEMQAAYDSPSYDKKQVLKPSR
jgi:hypothetical protein